MEDLLKEELEYFDFKRNENNDLLWEHTERLNAMNEEELLELLKNRVKEVDGYWEITVYDDEPGGNKSGISYKKQEGETIEDIYERFPMIIYEYQRLKKYGYS